MLNDEQLAKKSFRAMEDFIELKKKSDELVARVFKDPKIKIVKDAFLKFLNIDSNIVAEYLAKFLDFNLKKQSQDESQLNEVVSNVLDLFKLCNSKDVFEEFYTRGLSRRLLLKKSASYDSERHMLTRLRAECGTEFSNKCEAMLKDLTESELFMAEYRRMKPELQDGLEHHIHVLSQGSWPITAQQNKQLRIPPHIESLHTNFDSFYRKRHQGKCLTFTLHMATCLLAANFSSRQ